MNAWIDLHALWRIVVFGLLCGAGLPAIFAIGLRTLHTCRTSGTQAPGSIARANPLALVGAGLCFTIVLAAVGWGMYLIVAGR